MPPSCVGAIMHSRRRIGSGMSKCVRPRSATARSLVSCIHACSAVGAVQLVRGIGVEVLDRLGDRGAGQDLVGDPLLLLDHAGELLEAPLVRLVEVDLGADEVAGREGVVLAADTVGLRRVWRELALEELGHRGVCLGGRAGARLEVSLEGSRYVGAGGHAEEEAVGAALLAGLVGDLAHLADGRRVAGRDAGAQRVEVARHRAGNVVHAAARCAPSRPSVSVLMRSKMSRRSWPGEAMTLRSRCQNPASYFSTSRLSVRISSACVTASTSSAGTAVRTRASIALAASTAAAAPSGDRSA